jgi:hypothetical protein
MRTLVASGGRPFLSLKHLLVLTLVSAGPMTAPVGAQVAGGVVDLVKTHTFKSTGQPMWGPNQPANFSVRFFDLFFDTGERSGSAQFFVQDATLGDYGAAMGGSARASLGLSAGVDFTAGNIGVEYPISLKLTYPEPNSFRDGEEIPIRTSFQRQPNGKLTATEPFASVDVTGKIGFHGQANMQICFITCTAAATLGPVQYPSNYITTLQPETVRVFRLDTNTNATLPVIFWPTSLFPPVTEEKPLPFTFTGATAAVLGLSGTVDLPHAGIPCPALAVGCTHSVSEVGSSVLSGSVAHRFIDIVMDLDAWARTITKIPLGIAIPFSAFPGAPAGSTAKLDLVDAKVPLQIAEVQDFEFTPDPRVRLSFPQPVSYRVTEGTAPNETQVGQGTAMVIPFKVGQTLYLTFPAGKKTTMLGGSDFELKNRFRNRTRFTIDSDFVPTVGLAKLDIPSWQTPSVTTDLCHEATVTADPLDVFADKSCPVTTPSFTVPAVHEGLGPWYQVPRQLAEASFPIPLDPWELGGFAQLAGSTFTLDPEDAGLALTTSMVGGLAAGTGPAGTLVQTLRVENTGDVKLLTSQVRDALAVAFPTLPGFAVQTLTSPTLSRNASFNGVSVDATLTGNDELAVGGSGLITVQTRVAPGNIYRASANAAALTPIGTAVGASATARFAVYPMNFGPDKLNGAGSPNARVPLHVLNTASLPIQEIDLATVMIDGLAPLSWSYVLRNDVGPETDLALQFDRRALWTRIQARRAAIVAPQALATLLQTAPAPPALSSLANAVLGGAPMDPALAANADLLGNGNGRLDLGDLRAAAVARLSGTGSSIPSAAPPSGEVGVTLPLIGTMKDGTRFMAEDSIVVPTGG